MPTLNRLHLPLYLEVGDEVEVDVYPDEPMDLTGLPLEVVSSTIRGYGPNRVRLRATSTTVISHQDLFPANEFEHYRSTLAAYLGYRNRLISSLQQEAQS